MDRRKFLELCQRCAVFKSVCYGIKDGLPECLLVKHNGNKYYPYGYQMKFDETGKQINSAILHELKTNAVVYVLLDDVEYDLGTE